MIGFKFARFVASAASGIVRLESHERFDTAIPDRVVKEGLVGYGFKD